MTDIHQQSAGVAEELRSIWCDLLHRRTIQDSDSFFSLGGHSMMAMRLAARAERAFGCRLELGQIFDAPVFADQVAMIESHINRSTPAAAARIEKQPRPEQIPQSYAQQRMWFLDRLGGDPASYIMSGVLELKGPLDRDALAAAIRIIGRRHESLRTTFYSAAGQPCQKIHSEPLCELEILEFDGDAAARRSQAWEHMQRGAVEPFDLERGPLLRVRLSHCDTDEAMLLISMHHIISDGWSLGVLFGELLKIYEAFAGESGELDLDELPLQYADFTLWQRDYLSGAVLEEQLNYWRRQLDGIADQPLLPTDKARPEVLTFRGEQIVVNLDKETSAAIRDDRRFGVSPFMLILAAYSLVLQRFCHVRETVIGTVIANRTRSELESIIGFFVNTLSMRLQSRPGQTVREFLEDVRDVCYGAYAHQELPFERLVEDLKPGRNPAFTPIFQTLFTLNNTPALDMNLDGLDVKQIPLDLGVSKFELTVNCVDRGEYWELLAEFNTALFERDTIEALMQRLLLTLRAFTSDQDQSIDAIDMRSDDEVRLVDELNTTVKRSRELGHELYFHRMVAAHAQQRPDAIAVHDARREWSYADIHSAANRLAHALLERGARTEDRVAVLLPRSGEAIIAILGIMTAGCIYLPVDPEHPAERIDYVLRDSRARFIIGAEADARLHAHSDKLLLFNELVKHARADMPAVELHDLNIAYSIYTSGSTGRPKGVLLTHAGLGNLLISGREIMPVVPEDRVHFRFSFVFDASLWMLSMTLAHGATLYLSDRNDDLPGLTLNNYLREHDITIMTLTTSMAAITPSDGLDSLRLMGMGAEEVTEEVARRWMTSGRGVFNVYGPTEITICSTAHLITLAQGRLPIGTPFKHAQNFVLDGALRETPVGVDGELYIGGVGLARAYNDRPGLTASVFIPNPFSASGRGGERLYRTGDRVRRLPDGSLVFRGRVDGSQVKIRGFRIELNEIEAQLREHPQVEQAVAILRRDGDEQSIVAWLRGSSTQLPAEKELREWLLQRVPDYMVPSRLIFIDEIPLTAGGKVDRLALAARSLPAPVGTAAAQPAAPGFDDGKLETRVAAIWREVLPAVEAGPDDNFFEIGGHSLLVVRAHALLTERLDVQIPVVDLFRFPTIRTLARHLRSAGAADEMPTTVEGRAARPDEDIAIIAMSARFPRAADVEQFWENIRSGRDCIGRFAAEELMAEGFPAELLADSSFVRAKGVIPAADMFDADFFGMTPLEARLMAPHHRLFLEVVWECLESAACVPDSTRERVAVFAGGGYNTYQKFILDSDPELRAAVGDIQYGMGNEKDFLATFASYKFNLRGPSVNVQNACSTSLVALHLACRALQNGDAELAIAGGSTVHAPLKSGYRHEEGMIYSADGHCRPFSDASDGTVGSDGSAAVLLKPLSRALADGDTIHAVIKGSAINNDGRDKVGFTAPGVDGQASVIAAALADAGLSPADIDFIETHGTATVLGDPIEIAALNKVYKPNVGSDARVALASVKSNIGHTDTAAGLAGVIKTVMALKAGVIPPSLHFEAANPEIDFSRTPFYVNTELKEWPKRDSAPRRAGVSSFGIGGTNAHAIIEEFRAPARAGSEDPTDLSFVVSARSREALDKVRLALADRLEQNPDISLYDVAAVLGGGRRRFNERWTAGAQNRAQLIELLRRSDNDGALCATEPRNARPVMFMFSGQGSQHVGMARAIYERDDAFRELVDRQAGIVESLSGRDLCTLLFPPADQIEAAREELTQTSMAQPALFVIEYALAQRLIDWGIEPAALVGHSIGAFCAAALAGVMSLEDALKLVVERGRLMQAMPAGEMLSVMLPAAEIEKRREFAADENLAIGAVNTPDTCVISGPSQAIAGLEAALLDDGLESRRLHTSHAFHSPMMRAAAEQFLQVLRTVELHAPHRPMLLDSQAEWLDAARATDPQTWSDHVLSTVRFGACLERLFENNDAILLEVGPSNALKSLAIRHSSKPVSIDVLHCLPHPRLDVDAMAHLRRMLSHLWLAGADMDWFAVLPRARRIQLPTYPFERKRHWVDAKPGAGQNKKAVREIPLAGETLSIERENDTRRWLWKMEWERVPESKPPVPTHGPKLLLCDARADAELDRMRTRFTADPSAQIIEFDVAAAAGEILRLGDEEALFVRLRALPAVPETIVYGLMLGGYEGRPEGNADKDESELRAFHVLHSLARVIGRLGWTKRIDLCILTRDRFSVRGDEKIDPSMALSGGPFKVIGQEMPHVHCRTIDLEVGPQSLERALNEIFAPSGEPVIALRGRLRLRPAWHRVEAPTQESVNAAIGSEPVILITGGFGGIGMALAGMLASKYSAKIALLGRRSFPARSEWDDFDGSNGHRETAEQIALMRRWEDQGAQVLTVRADVSNYDDLQAALARVRAEFGELTGIVHAAGLPGGGALALRDRAAVETVFAPKITGLRNILRAVESQEAPPAFVALCSSMASVLGGFGQIDYVAANDWLNAMAHSRANRNDSPTKFIALDWGQWAAAGMATQADLPGEYRRQLEVSLANGIGNEEGAEAFGLALASGYEQLVINPYDWRPLLNFDFAAAEAVEAAAVAADKQSGPAERPALSTAWEAPQNEIETAIAATWTELLGLPELGRNDDFFELGGHSLLATRVVTRLREQYSIDITLGQFFDAPTIGGLAATIHAARQAQLLQAPIADDPDEEYEEGEL